MAYENTIKQNYNFSVFHHSVIKYSPYFVYLAYTGGEVFFLGYKIQHRFEWVIVFVDSFIAGFFNDYSSDRVCYFYGFYIWKIKDVESINSSTLYWDKLLRVRETFVD